MGTKWEAVVMISNTGSILILAKFHQFLLQNLWIYNKYQFNYCFKSYHCTTS